jgi:putative ABC transport system permease protein
MRVPVKVNLRSLLVRRTATALTVVGIGLIVMALTVTWGLKEGLESVFELGGDPETLVVLRGGSKTETTSGILDEAVRIVKASEGIDQDAQGAPLAAGELVVIINLPRRGAVPNAEGSRWAVGSNVLVRGISAQSLALRPGARIVEGRMLVPGRNEIMASPAMAERFEGCALGEVVTLRRVPYTVVGLFTTEGTPYESELWTDADDLGATFSRRGAVSSLLLKASDPLARERLRATLKEDPRLDVEVKDQEEYFEAMSGDAAPLVALGALMTFFLSVGACFAAANTMYASVMSRAREVGTLRALGFSRLSILLSYLIESLAVSLAAGVLGLLLGGVVLLFSGTAGMAGSTFSETTFSMRITPFVVVACMATCAFVGAVGGLLPAIRAARMPIVEALRSG